MNHNSLAGQVRLTLVLAAATFFLAALANAQTAGESSTSTTVTHIMGLEGVRNNANGKLTVGASGLQFAGEGGSSDVSIASIRDIFVGSEDRQVGGVPMMMGKAAIPYSGGRVISLFSHKKYDSLVVEYTDANGGLHGAIFRIGRGQGWEYRKQLVAKGAKASPVADIEPATQEVKNDSK
ncbi:MAG TPA: hypothetical protein VE994_03105 [Terriglobales bacterium]|nr:hypothetical protein [Terriglobales bacterium]